MKLLLLIVVIVVVIAAAGYGATSLTADDRAQTGRTTLDKAAARFMTCFRKDHSFDTCDPGTSKVAVVQRSARAFTLAYAADFTTGRASLSATTYTISGRSGGSLSRTCGPRGSHCPEDGWRSIR